MKIVGTHTIEIIEYMEEVYERSSGGVWNQHIGESMEVVHAGREERLESEYQKMIGPLTIGFEVPDSSQDIQMMSVWAESLKRFETSPEHKTAALKWFKSYAESEIKKQKIDPHHGGAENDRS